ncbi:MAG: SMC-Scp complex subunit ScpB [Phycisphaerales bacterium]
MDDVPEMMPKDGGIDGKVGGEAADSAATEAAPDASVATASPGDTTIETAAESAPVGPAPVEPAAEVAATNQIQASAAPVKRGRRRAVVVEIPIPPVEELSPVVEAVLLSTPRPVVSSALAHAAGLSARNAEDENADPIVPMSAIEAVEGAIAALNQSYESTGRSFRIEALAGGWRVMTLPKFAGAIAAFHKAREAAGLSRAALETLAIIAYKQPITRAELESIRGVACGEVLRSLIDKRLVTITGRAEELGRPLLYGTTRQFLDAFGLATLKDLPTLAELKLPN